MKHAVENIDPTRVKLTVEVDYDELKPAIDAAYKSIANQVTIPGFRKDKIPARIIEQRFGWGAIVEQAINSELGRYYSQAINEAGLKPLAQPEVEVDEIPEKAGEGQLKFTAEVDVRPEITLPELSSLSIEVDPVEITEADVDARLDAHRERFSTLVGVDRPAKDGDFVTVDLRAVIGDEEIDAVNGISYQIGDGSLLEGLDEALTGLSADETTTFESNLAGGDHAGEAAQVTVTASAVKERELPDADDDFAQMASEFDTIGELREDLSKEVGTIKRGNQAVAARELLVEKLLDAVDVPLPERVLTEAVDRHLASEGKAADDEHRADAEAEETKGFRAELVLDALAEKLGVKVGQSELADFLVHTSQQYGMDPQEFIANLDRTGRIPAMVADLARNKAVAAALRQVSVKDTSGTVIDLTEFIGSDEADEAQRALADAAQDALASNK